MGRHPCPLEHGLGKFLKRAVSAEGTRLTKAEGTGRLYLADDAKEITVLGMQGDDIFVNGNDVLAFEPTLQWDITMMRTVAWSGSLSPAIHTDMSLKTFLGRGSGESIQLKFEGTGFVVIQPKEERAFQAQGSGHS